MISRDNIAPPALLLHSLEEVLGLLKGHVMKSNSVRPDCHVTDLHEIEGKQHAFDGFFLHEAKNARAFEYQGTTAPGMMGLMA